MKKIRLFTMALMAGAAMVSCSSVAEEQSPAQTVETEQLLASLKSQPDRGIMYGHHDATVYGIGWEGDEDRSDVKSVCGDHPAVISFDLGELELGGQQNLDKVAFDKIRQEAVRQFERGGMVSMSWHARNPKTGGDAWDNSDSTVVRSVLPGGECHETFVGWLDRLADFLSSLKTDDGVKVPVLFRPWHEHTGGWFWWGERLCSADDYKALWRLTANRLAADGVNNVLYAYSSGIEPADSVAYLAKYPGDDIVDVIGFDAYQFDHDTYVEWMTRMLAIVDCVGKAHDKVVAVTETGFEGIPDEKWWTGTVLPLLADYRLAYILTWRNAREKEGHFFAPYPGQASADDFVEFYSSPKTLFANDVDLYK